MLVDWVVGHDRVRDVIEVHVQVVVVHCLVALQLIVVEYHLVVVLLR